MTDQELSENPGFYHEQDPPADRLAYVRSELKRLKAIEDELRQLMLSDPEARTGNKYCVEVKDVSVTRTDWKELRACHPALADEFTGTFTEKRVELRGISEDGEIVSLRRKPAKEIQP